MCRADEHWIVAAGKEAESENGAAAFAETVALDLKSDDARRSKLDQRLAELSRSVADPKQKQRLLNEIIKIVPEQAYYRVELAYAYAAAGQWEAALNGFRWFLKLAGRENAARLTCDLMTAGMLAALDRKPEAERHLNQFVAQTREPWHRSMAQAMLGAVSESDLLAQARNIPERLLTAGAIMGLWAETQDEDARAADLYRETLGTYLNRWPQFGFAFNRLNALKIGGGNTPQ